ncbi:predicted protein [Histoplasma capsulatum H143]|uniref:Uncharacterized protein n=1 Tax=Ajellomyces capsulatus (strain H143) TaxID=544712 RepID=C6HK80_AJECH|nr:predicted protein [Histoplasma capsulatum H143]
MQFDRIPNTLDGSNQTSQPALQPQILLGCTVFVWSLGSRTDKSSEQIIHVPLNPKPPKSDATARELNSERFLGFFEDAGIVITILVGPGSSRRQEGTGFFGSRREK